MIYDVHVTSVDYYVGAENEDALGKTADKIKATLPQELCIDIDCEPEDLEGEIANAISEETSWLNNSFTYEIMATHCCRVGLTKRS